MALANVETTVVKETSTWTRVWLEGQDGKVNVRFTKGQQVRVGTIFRDTAGVKVAPSSVTLTVKKPDGTTSTPSLTNPATGEYHALVTLDQSGVWRWRFTSTGKVAADEGQFVVDASYF